MQFWVHPHVWWGILQITALILQSHPTCVGKVCPENTHGPTHLCGEKVPSLILKNTVHHTCVGNTIIRNCWVTRTNPTSVGNSSHAKTIFSPGTGTPPLVWGKLQAQIYPFQMKRTNPTSVRKTVQTPS